MLTNNQTSSTSEEAELITIQNYRKYLANFPIAESIGNVMGRAEEWAFDYGATSDSLSQEQEVSFNEAGEILSGLLKQLEPSVELINFFLAVSTSFRLYYFSVFERENPGLVPKLALFAIQHEEDSPACAHLVHWLQTMDQVHDLVRYQED